MATIDVLLVEDEPDIREIITLALTRDPRFQVDACTCGADALRSITSGNRHFDVGLLDFRLPDMTGLDLHRKIRQHPDLSDCCAILITASVMDIAKSLPQEYAIHPDVL